MEPAFGGSNPPAPAIRPGGSRARRRLVTACKVAVTAGLLGWLLSRTDVSEIHASLAGARAGWVLAAFGLHFVGVWLSALRWRLLLRAQGAEATLDFLVRSLLVGIFFNNFLPSTVGGDLMRARDTAGHAGSGTGALTVVLVERVSGILVLGFFALAASVAGALGPIGAAGPTLAAAAVLLLGFAAFTLLLRPPAIAALRRALVRCRSRWRGVRVTALLGKADRLLDTLGALARAPGTMRTTLLLAFALQANVVVHFWCVAQALALNVAPGAFLVIVPIATVLLLLPVSVNGIGAREAVFTVLLGQEGVGAAQALAFSWLAFGTVLAQGILGGVVYALRRTP